MLRYQNLGKDRYRQEEKMNKNYFAKIAGALALVVVMAVVSLNRMSTGGQEMAEEMDSVSRMLVTSGDPLRIAVFGSSHSWGATLEDRFMAYPYRLSPRVDNFAYFASGK